jgi:hypothetical protein
MVATVLEEWLEHDLGEKFGVRLAATVTTAIHENFRSYDKHLAFLSVEAYVKSATALNVLLDFLRRYVVKDPQELHAMQNNADHLARTSLGEWSKDKG